MKNAICTKVEESKQNKKQQVEMNENIKLATRELSSNFWKEKETTNHKI